MAEMQEEIREDRIDNKDSINTISTKLSTDQLICKTPQGSPNGSIRNCGKLILKNEENSLLCLGVLQFAFGFLMVIFGGLAIHYDAGLSQLGAGIWSGCLAMATGIIGILASANEWCPLKSTPQKITHTVFLALSLVSLAMAQLVVALSATGSGRDFNSSEYEAEEEAEITTTTQTPSGKISIVLPDNYPTILANLGLVVVSVGEFIVAAVASYKSSRTLCPCFRSEGEHMEEVNAHKNALVSSWLGKHSPTPQLYVVATGPPSSLGKGSKMSGLSVTPVFAMPPHQMVHQPRVMGYPLIPAPLGSIPSPIIPPSPPARELLRKKKKRHSYARCGPREVAQKKSKSKSKLREKVITDEEVAKSYTGLDKAIAEEFIDICDSRNVSLCSDSSCTSSCQRGCNGCNNNCDDASREYLVNKA